MSDRRQHDLAGAGVADMVYSINKYVLRYLLVGWRAAPVKLLQLGYGVYIGGYWSQLVGLLSMTFNRFARTGIPVMLLLLVLSSVYLIILVP